MILLTMILACGSKTTDKPSASEVTTTEATVNEVAATPATNATQKTVSASTENNTSATKVTTATKITEAEVSMDENSSEEKSND